MSLVAPTRKQLGISTLFNLLGPLSNPLHPKRLVVGVHSPGLGRLMAEALELSGIDHGLVVCGAEGLDEVI